MVCAHSRPYEYFAESVFEGKAARFMAIQCNSLSSLRNGKCKMKPVEMGLSTPPKTRGNFYLETNKRSPFCKRIKVDLQRRSIDLCNVLFIKIISHSFKTVRAINPIHFTNEFHLQSDFIKY